MAEQAISPLRRRMIEDMTIRMFAKKTQHDYVQRVKDFASYLKRSPDTATPDDVRGFQLCFPRRCLIDSQRMMLRIEQPSARPYDRAGRWPIARW
jgi:hypothetical protein